MAILGGYERKERRKSLNWKRREEKRKEVDLLQMLLVSLERKIKKYNF